MEIFTNWFGKKKRNSSVQDYSEFEVDKDRSDSFYGGFKEYKPPIYEHESVHSSGIKVTDLISDHVLKG